MREMDQRAARVPPDGTFISGSIGRRTRMLEDNIRLEEALRTATDSPIDRSPHGAGSIIG
jgi:hypothetical protein